MATNEKGHPLRGSQEAGHHAYNYRTAMLTGTPWHGTERGTRRFMARHGKSWHGKILARHGTENLGTEKSWHGMARKKSHVIVFWGNSFGYKNPRLFHKMQSPHLAILINIWHIWEDRSRKVNNDEPDLRFFHGNFWPVISRTIRKPCPRGCMGFTIK